MKRSIGSLCIGAGTLLLLSCGDPSHVAGNSANTGNGVSAGRILAPSGSPAPGVRIQCRPDTLTPWDDAKAEWTTFTDSLGRYRCTELPHGAVGVSAWDPGSGLSRWRRDSITAPRPFDTGSIDTLAPAGALRVALPPGTAGTLFLTGLDLSVAVGTDQEILIPSIPAGWTGSVRIARSSRSSDPLDTGIQVAPGTTDSAGYTRSSGKIRITLGGQLAKGVANFPLLVRLDSSWHGFAASLPNGSDLRAALPDGTPLPLTMASWDRATSTGSFWALLDTLAAPADSIDLVLSWGIPVPPAPVAQAFGTDAGWIAAWPLGDTGSFAMDRLGTFSGTMSKGTSVAGSISKATRFDGRSSQIVIQNSETGALALPEGGPFTYSCWVRLGAYGSPRYVLGRGQEGPGIFYLPTWGRDTNVWSGREHRDSPSGISYTDAHADTAAWTHLALTVSDTTVALYINGARQSTTSGFNAGSIGRRPLPFMIGASIDTAGLTSTSSHFLGDISEVWVQSVARSPEWIRLAAMNQKPDAAPARPVN